MEWKQNREEFMEWKEKRNEKNFIQLDQVILAIGIMIIFALVALLIMIARNILSRQIGLPGVQVAAVVPLMFMLALSACITHEFIEEVENLRVERVARFEDALLNPPLGCQVNSVTHSTVGDLLKMPLYLVDSLFRGNNHGRCVDYFKKVHPSTVNNREYLKALGNMVSKLPIAIIVASFRGFGEAYSAFLHELSFFQYILATVSFILVLVVTIMGFFIFRRQVIVQEPRVIVQEPHVSTQELLEPPVIVHRAIIQEHPVVANAQEIPAIVQETRANVQEPSLNEQNLRAGDHEYDELFFACLEERNNFLQWKKCQQNAVSSSSQIEMPKLESPSPRISSNENGSKPETASVENSMLDIYKQEKLEIKDAAECGKSEEKLA